MRLVSFLILLGGIGLAGCAGHSLDCSLGTPWPDCAPDTPGYQIIQQERQAAEATAVIDDARCRSYGLKPGSPDYTKCRADIDSKRPPVRP